jgi:hypothetical protein
MQLPDPNMSWNGKNPKPRPGIQYPPSPAGKATIASDTLLSCFTIGAVVLFCPGRHVSTTPLPIPVPIYTCALQN